MPAIHHATAKRAANNGVELIVRDETVVAQWNDFSIKSDDAKVALDAMLLQKRIEAEFPGAATVKVETEEDNRVIVAVGDETEEIDDVHNIDEAYATFCDSLGELAENHTEDAEESDELGRDVIAAKYRAQWSEEGHPDHCGDWLATTLEGMFERTNADGVTGFHVDTFTDFLESNGVVFSGKWAALPTSGQRGWVGRYRMNGRQKLEGVLARRGTLLVRNDEGHMVEIPVPPGFLSALRVKFAKAIAKEAKAAK